ncbi:MAG: BglG family transcription antiterminator [Clostridium saudiense]
MIKSPRLQKILELLFENTEIITGEFLCNNLGVSSRTVRSDIKELNKILERNGASIVSEKARGYKLNIKNEVLFNSLINNNKSKGEDSSTALGRAESIISQFLINNLDNIEGITQIELADRLFISVSSLKNDMKIVKDILEKYHLNIEKISNKGLRIIGEEEDIRSCIKKYNKGNTELSERIQESLNLILGNNNEEIITTIVKSNIDKFDFKLSDKALRDIISLILIMIVRNNNHNNVKYSEETKKKLSEAWRYGVAKVICDDIYERFGIVLEEIEILYLTKYMVFSSSIKIKTKDGMKLNNEYELVRKILLKIKDKFNINLLEDNVLIDFLVHHLKASIYRAQYGIIVENSLLSAIKNNYPFALELSVYSNEIIKEAIGCDLKEDDIGFIALHFAAAIERLKDNLNKNKKNVMIVCENGVGTSLLLKVKLEAKFKDRINIIDTIPKYEFNEEILNSYDLIISTINLKSDSEKIIYVKSLLDNGEIAFIEDKFNGNSLGNNVLVSKFKESLFFNHLDVDTRDEALENITSKLIDEGYITQCVKENIFKREDLASTEIGELVAIPHDMNEEIKQSFISVSVFNKAITWDKEKVQVVFFIGMSMVDKEEWKSYLEQIYKNIIDGEIIRKIIKCQNFEELKMLVSKF